MVLSSGSHELLLRVSAHPTRCRSGELGNGSSECTAGGRAPQRLRQGVVREDRLQLLALEVDVGGAQALQHSAARGGIDWCELAQDGYCS